MVEVNQKHTDGVERFVARNHGIKLGYALAFRKKGVVKIGYLENSSGVLGVGSILMQAILDWAEETGSSEVVGDLAPVPGCEKAIVGLLEKFGFDVDVQRGKVRKCLG